MKNFSGVTVNTERNPNPRTYDWLEDALLTVCRNAFSEESSLLVHSLLPRIHRVYPHRDYKFLLQSSDAEIHLVLRLYHGSFSIWSSVDRQKSAREYSALFQSYQVGIPVSFPYGFTTSEIPFGKPYLLQDPGDGQPWWDVEDSLRLIQGEIVHDLAEELAKVHFALRTPPPLIPTVEFHDVMKQLGSRVMGIAGDDLKRCFDRCLHDMEDIEPLPDVLLHGQFDLDHLLLKNGRIRTIMDWEFAAFGDPRWDLAHTCLSLQRGKERSLSNQFIARYSQITGIQVDHLILWEGMVALRNWALSTWLRSLDEKVFLSIAGLQTPLIDREDAMRERALDQFS